MLKKGLESQGTSQCGNLIAVALKTVISVHNQSRTYRNNWHREVKLGQLRRAWLVVPSG